MLLKQSCICEKKDLVQCLLRVTNLTANTALVVAVDWYLNTLIEHWDDKMIEITNAIAASHRRSKCWGRKGLFTHSRVEKYKSEEDWGSHIKMAS